MIKRVCGGVLNRYMSKLVVLLHSDSMLYKIGIKVGKLYRIGYSKLMKISKMLICL